MCITLYGVGVSFSRGWVEVHWSKFFHEVGFSSVDKRKPLDWKDFFQNQILPKSLQGFGD